MSEKNNDTANNEQTALTAGGFAALANVGALNDATEDLAGLDLTFDRVLNEEEKAAIVVMTESVKNYAANLTMSALAEGNDDAPFVDAETGEVIEPLKK